MFLQDVDSVTCLTWQNHGNPLESWTWFWDVDEIYSENLQEIHTR